MLPGDRLICAFMGSQTVGLQFSAWLLHVTIVPWFRVDETSGVIVRNLQTELQYVVPFMAITDGEALFGPQKSRPVRLLQPVAPFRTLEQKVRGYLHEKRAWLVDETAKRPREFAPHVTDQADARLHESDTFWCDRLYIVEQKGKLKEVVGEIRLGETAA